jgi:hypothetical protein
MVRKATQRRRPKWTTAQRFDLCKTVYLVGEGRPFATEEARRAAWEEHREELLYSGNPGSRPGAFWQYDYPGSKIPHESDLQALFRLGLLLEGEAARLSRIQPWPPPPATGQDPRRLLARAPR